MPPKRVSQLRPVQAGTRIINPVHRALGSIGLIATDAGGARWALSCAHVLVRTSGWTGGPAADDEPIHQPKDLPEDSIARTDLTMVAPAHDAAAARLDDAIDAAPEILDLGVPGAPRDATVGMLVTKSGSRTGVTDGVVRAVTPDLIIIEPAGAPTDTLTKNGDSGAVWLDAHTLEPVAMHTQGNVGGAERSFAVPIIPVLAALGLTVLAPPPPTPTPDPAPSPTPGGD